ncbi:LamG domain-containing protein [Negadavirga shengliensis]|uniref:LamG domain-containing protein n=1 Tax=Negadavirga shengliensis TaxID=1389218 RepID=A0ABV9SZ14_9BACT
MMVLKFLLRGPAACAFFLFSCIEKEPAKVEYILNIKGLVAMWDFNESAGEMRIAKGMGQFPLMEMNGEVARTEEGPLSGYAASLTDSAYFSLPHKQTGQLNIHGKDRGVTVMAWVKWKGNTGFVGGMWNEHTDGGKRQYGLFVHLPHYNGADQVCGHISFTGKPTPPFPYSCDYSASRQTLERDHWHFIAFTYDGYHIKSYLDGKFEEREPELIRNTTGFEGYPEGMIQSKNPYYFPDGMGNNGSDFTVGAVVLSRGMGNFFEGYIDGLAVFDRALSDKEISEIHEKTMN